MLMFPLFSVIFFYFSSFHPLHISHAPPCCSSNSQDDSWLRDLALSVTSSWNSTHLNIGRVSSFVLSDFSSKFTFTVGHWSQYLKLQPSVFTLHIIHPCFTFLLNIDYSLTHNIDNLFSTFHITIYIPWKQAFFFTIISSVLSRMLAYLSIL